MPQQRRNGCACLAVIGSGLLPAPAFGAPAADPLGPCALRATGTWLSEGVTPWDDVHVRPLGTGVLQQGEGSEEEPHRYRGSAATASLTRRATASRACAAGEPGSGNRGRGRATPEDPR